MKCKHFYTEKILERGRILFKEVSFNETITLILLLLFHLYPATAVFSFFFSPYWETDILASVNLGAFLEGASLVTQTVKNLPIIQETWDQSLGWEDLLEKGMATDSSILAWRISWTQQSGGLQSMGSQRVRHDWTTNTGREKVYKTVGYISQGHIASLVKVTLIGSWNGCICFKEGNVM